MFLLAWLLSLNDLRGTSRKSYGLICHIFTKFQFVLTFLYAMTVAHFFPLDIQ